MPKKKNMLKLFNNEKMAETEQAQEEIVFAYNHSLLK